MKSGKDRIFLIISLAYILITGGFNLYGYFHLPEEVATQFSFSGGQVNHMPTPVYLAISFTVVLILSLFCITKGQQKLKYLLADTLIVIVNIVMIAMQL